VTHWSVRWVALHRGLCRVLLPALPARQTGRLLRAPRRALPALGAGRVRHN